MNFRQLAYGIMSFVPWAPASLHTGTGGTLSAEYCYCVWLRHLVLARAGGMASFPAVVAELGPGDSIGVGLAALVSGADRYVALDAIKHASNERNLQVFERLVELFAARAPIPGPESFPEIAIALPSYAFPRDIISDERLDRAMSPARLGRIRSAIGAGSQSGPIEYRVPWRAASEGDYARPGSVDLLVSQAVMEHVEDLAEVYRASHALLRPGAFASHQIDLRSHGLFRAWDGHWSCPEWLWALIRGRRPYLLNRMPLMEHQLAIQAAGFRVNVLIRVLRASTGSKVARRFAEMSEEDRDTCGAYLLLLTQ